MRGSSTSPSAARRCVEPKIGRDGVRVGPPVDCCNQITRWRRRGRPSRLAALVDSKMRAVAAQGRTVDSLRVAVLAALNLADELLQAQSGSSDAAARVGHARAASLRGLLDEVLLDDERKTGS